MSISRKITEGAGSGGGSGETYVDDVFSTDVFDTELEVSNTITNGIDLAGEGGMIWLKTRDTPGDSTLHDSERGLEYGIYTTGTDPHYDFVDLGFTKPIFSSDGYTTSTARVYSKDGKAVGWTFRKARSFFDVVTYTGDGVDRTVPHNLGSVPGMIIVKRTDASGTWPVWHTSISTGTIARLLLNESTEAQNSSTIFTSTPPTSSGFTVGTSSDTNSLNGEYVAYVFAHDDSDEGLIQCGSFVPADTWGSVIDLGWEPQFLMIKNADGSGEIGRAHV